MLSSMPEDRIWYLWTGDGQQGPYTPAELLAWKETGHISDEWYVWREGYENWRLVGETKELFAQPEAAISPLPRQPVRQGKQCPSCNEVSDSWTRCSHCGIVFKVWESKTPAERQEKRTVRRKNKAQFFAINVSIFILILGTPAAAFLGWRWYVTHTSVVFTSPDGHYSVKLPRTHADVMTDVAQEQGSDQNGNPFAIKVTTHSVFTDEHSLLGHGTSIWFFIMTHFEVPSFLLASDKTDAELLETLMKIATGSIEVVRPGMGVLGYRSYGGTMTHRRNITYEQHPGLEVFFEAKHSYSQGPDSRKSVKYGKTRAYKIGSFFVVLMFAGHDPTALDDPRGAAFFESFKML